MRRIHPPALRIPSDDVRSAIERQLGATKPRDIIDRLAAIERKVQPKADTPPVITGAWTDGSAGSALAEVLESLGLIRNLSEVLGDPRSIGIPMDKAVKSNSATSVTSTTGATIVNFNTEPLQAGVRYRIWGIYVAASNADPAGLIYPCVRLQATGSTVDGFPTGTAGGERTLVAFDSKEIIGTGSTENIAGRSRVSSGTGSVNGAIVFGGVFPIL